MRKHTGALLASLTLALLFCAAIPALSEDKPVTIAFDAKSKRMDMVTEIILPEYTQAQRGSIQFFFARLDSPDDFVNYTHDGIRKAEIKALRSMEKVQEQHAVWRLNYKGGGKNTPRIQHQAVSFIPINPDTGKPDRRVYLMLNDLTLIDWGSD